MTTDSRTIAVSDVLLDFITDSFVAYIRWSDGQVERIPGFRDRNDALGAIEAKRRAAAAPPPPPVCKTVEAVREDLLHRSQLGIAKYGKTLSGNPLSLREWLQHAYEECLDQANYLKRAIQQIDGEAGC